jgi:acetyltransferase-like isoleucine patch superfamily enzyme
MDSRTIVRQLRHDPLRVAAVVSGLIRRTTLRWNSRVRLGSGVRFIGWPVIDVRGRCQITLGSNVVLNSRNRGYFAALFSPVKLFADHDGATITIGDNTRIHGSCIHAYASIAIGSNCLIAGNTVIIDSDGHDPFPKDLADRMAVQKRGKPIVIENNVWIGLNCTILKGVRIGEGAIIGAGSVVREDVPARCVVMGNPARIVKSPTPVESLT